ncbi:protein of unknown function [Petrocella atlantisensis]|uniref:Uncharacterized protein n=1 Tax=Petrocella atlantisensis TaxID=2173034 RepID=A0A3P7PG98_9FIRM|nr:protein of unknown function [Petrocella atlantisensis]
MGAFDSLESSGLSAVEFEEEHADKVINDNVNNITNVI